MNNKKLIFGCIFSGFMMGMAQQPLGLGWLAWFSLIPLIFVLNECKTKKLSFFIGYLWGIIYYLHTIFWLAMNIGTTPFVGMISMIISVLYCSLNSAFICLIIFFFKSHYDRRWIWLFPFVWTSVEYIRNMDVLTGGPWTSLANTQIDFLTLVQNVEIFGIYGVSFWIVILNVAIFNWIDRPYTKHAFLMIPIYFLPWLSGLYLTPNPNFDNNKSLDVSLVQPNIHLFDKRKKNSSKEIIESIIEFSKSEIIDSVDLLIWPESALPAYILQKNKLYLNLIQSSLNSTKLLTGLPYYVDINNDRKKFNSAVVLSSSNTSEVYNKLVLVPLGEYIPLSTYFPSFSNIDLGQANFTHGDEFKLFKINEYLIASMICFESTIPSLSTRFVRSGAEVLVYLVNDGWYEHPPEPQQHAKQAIFRAIENRRPVLRCANTGISMIIDKTGNIIKKISLNEKGIINASIVPNNRITFYTRYGDLLAQLSLIVSLSFVFLIIPRKK
tara:strand:+ start:182 stop:1669 length:1488 start_codon:yes stop_codon:yes gene_type:complete